VTDKEDVLFLALIEVLDSYVRRIPAALAGLTDSLQRFHAAVAAFAPSTTRGPPPLCSPTAKRLRCEKCDAI
jgi:hypothetical protein